MQFQINTDAHILGTEALSQQTESQILHHIARFESRITRVEVHLKDENSDKKGGPAMRCLLEARIVSHQPVAVSHQAETIELAVEGAAKKLKHALDSVVGRLSDR